MTPRQFSLAFIFREIFCIAAAFACLRLLDPPFDEPLLNVTALLGAGTAVGASLGGFLGSMRIGALVGAACAWGLALLLDAMTAVRV